MCTIKCCQFCKPPKRYPGCGDHCDEYKAEKALWISSKPPLVVAHYTSEAKTRQAVIKSKNSYRVKINRD